MRRRPATLALAALGLTVFALVAWGVLRGLTPDAPLSALDPPNFVEEAAAAGIDHRYDGDFIYFVGGGVAVFDCNDDGRQEIYLAGGEAPAALYRNESEPGGALHFSPVPHATTDLTQVTGAYPLDVDSDGRTDLAVLRYGENVLLRGLGDCRFERANATWQFDGGSVWTTAFSATWERAAEWPTVAIGNYFDQESDDREHLCLDSALIRPNPAGNGFGPSVPLTPSWCPLSMLFSDWNHSGRRDLRVSNDRHYYVDFSAGEEQLWKVEPGRPPSLWSHDQGWQTVRVWGMGIASQDLTGDGFPEVFLTSQGDNKLQTLADGTTEPRYDNIALERGVTARRPFAGDVEMRSTAWHAEFQDVNNDGLMDLFISKGNVEAQPDFAALDPSNLLLGQPDGTFIERAEAAGVLSFSRARGAALADFNLDGMLDLIVVNRRENVKLWRNVGWGDADHPTRMGNWVALDLAQAGPNGDAIGAWVEVTVGDRTIWHEVTVGGGHVGGQLGWIHIGLGSAERADVAVHWPDGEDGPRLTVETNRFYVIERGATEALPWTPGWN
ncbi:MAG: VCBS repeat-containing protein [Chloroflexota bacterium]|nr:VCBS repeat-containing protein [Chloroflexota bacterium]